MTSNYTYDALYELTQVTQSANTTESYTYDPVGNRLSSLGVSPYTNNTSNELTSTPNASYAYDYNGNTTSKTVSAGTTNYAWDYENRLASVTLPGTGGSITFKYDPFGRRIQKAFTQNSTTTTTNYLYDGSNAVEDLDQNGNLLARYAETQNIDEPLAEQRSGTTSYYEADGLGSVTSLTNSAGAIANSYTYDSFGQLTASTGSITNRFQYTAREFDSESGLYYYRARYYDPSAGRFLSEDPTNSGPNLYSYVSNAPTYWTDPTGETKKIPTDCGELVEYMKEVIRIYEAKWFQYDPKEDGSGTIPKAGGGFYAPGVHYKKLVELQVKIIKAIKYWDDNCGGPGNPSPVCDEQRKLVRKPIPLPIFPLSQPVVSPDTGAKIVGAVGVAAVAGELLSLIGEYGWVAIFAF